MRERERERERDGLGTQGKLDGEARSMFWCLRGLRFGTSPSLIDKLITHSPLC